MSKLITKTLFLFIFFISVSFQTSMTQIHIPHLKSFEKESQLQHKQTQQVIQDLNALPLYFVDNKGQIDERVQYQLKLSGMNVYFTSQEIVYQFFHRETPPFWVNCHTFVQASFTKALTSSLRYQAE